MRRKIIESFKQPLLRKNLMDLLIGGVLMFFPVVNFISLGYLFQKLKFSINLEKKKIKWDENLKKLFIDGARLFFFSIIYLLIPIFFMVLEVFFTSILSHGEIASLYFFRGLILIIFSTVLFLLSLYFFLFGICIYAEENSMKKGFDLKEIIEKIYLVPKEYSVVYIISIGVIITSLVIVSLLLNWVTGLLISGFLFFYDGLVIVNLLSKFYPRKSIEVQLPF